MTDNCGKGGLVAADIDAVPYGTFIYSMERVPLGVVVRYLQCNGNGPDTERRHLDNGKRKDRFADRRDIMYQMAKGANMGSVLFKRG